MKQHDFSKDRRSKRSGLRIRGRVKNRKDTRAEKMTVSGELMPVIDSLFSMKTHYCASALSPLCAITVGFFYCKRKAAVWKLPQFPWDDPMCIFSANLLYIILCAITMESRGLYAPGLFLLLKSVFSIIYAFFLFLSFTSTDKAQICRRNSSSWYGCFLLVRRLKDIPKCSRAQISAR